MKDLNRNKLCSIACRVTEAGELGELSIIPLDDLLKIDGIPFSNCLKIINTDVKRMVGIQNIINNGLDVVEFLEIFNIWYDSLKLDENKRIVPIVCGWQRKLLSMHSIFGTCYFDYFSDQYVDLECVCKYLNHRVALDDCKFTHLGIHNISAALGIEKDKCWDGLYLANLKVKAYKKLVLGVFE